MVARERHESVGIMETEDVHPSRRFLMQNGTVSGGGATTDVGPTAVAKLRQKEQQRGGVTMAEAWRNHHYSSPASRICRVSRASGGKDRHSKVLTAKGLRDRRVRLSVSTAIQFYDLQDRLGYDQPSKAVEWLIKAAAAAIADLPSLDAAFPNVEKPPPGTEDAEGHQQHEQHLTKSACSSTSETSKGSVLSLARSETRVKARERARGTTATAKEKEKEKDRDDDDTQFASVAHQQSLNLHPSSSHSSFIDLLTGGNHHNHNHNHSHAAAVVKAELFGQVGHFSEGGKPHHPPGFPTETHFNIAAAAALAAGDHPEMQQQQQQQFAFMPEHLIPLAATAAGGDYINFSISPSGIAGFNRGTLQSNFASLQPNNHHLQRLSSSLDGSNLPFFLGPASQPASAAWEGTLPGGFDGRLHLCYDGHRHSDLKGKGRN